MADDGFRTQGTYLKDNCRHGLTPAMEDYLEMIYRLCKEDGSTRVGRLSGRLHVRPSSVSKMIDKLTACGYVRNESYDSIYLTEEGTVTAAYLLRRHDTVERFLRFMGNLAPLEETELLEHSFNFETVAEIERLLDFFVCNPDVSQRFAAFVQEDKDQSPPVTKD